MYVCVFALVLNISCLTIFCVTALYRCVYTYLQIYIHTYLQKTYIDIYLYAGIILFSAYTLPPGTRLKPTPQFTDISGTVCAIKNGTFLFMSPVAFLFCIVMYICLLCCSAADPLYGSYDSRMHDEIF